MMSSVFLLIPVISFSQLTLRIEIDGLRNISGQILLELKNEKEEQIEAITKIISKNSCVT